MQLQTHHDASRGHSENQQSEDQLSKALDEATLHYLNCPDPTEAAARRLRVLSADAIRHNEETTDLSIGKRFTLLTTQQAIHG